MGYLLDVHFDQLAIAFESLARGIATVADLRRRIALPDALFNAAVAEAVSNGWIKAGDELNQDLSKLMTDTVLRLTPAGIAEARRRSHPMLLAT